MLALSLPAKVRKVTEAGVWLPARLFAGSEVGLAYDFGDAATLFSDSAGTTAASNGGGIGLVRDKSGRNNHATQATTASKPRWDGTYATFDGFDDFLSTASLNFTGTDKVTVVAGVYKASDAAVGMPCELSANANANTGAFRLTTGNPANTYEAVSYGGAASSAVSPATYTPPVASVIAMSASITADQLILRANGTQVASSVSDQGAASSYGNYPIYIGRRGGSSLPFNGRIYRLIVIGRALTASELAQAERWCAQPTGVVLP